MREMHPDPLNPDARLTTALRALAAAAPAEAPSELGGALSKAFRRYHARRRAIRRTVVGSALLGLALCFGRSLLRKPASPADMQSSRGNSAEVPARPLAQVEPPVKKFKARKHSALSTGDFVILSSVDRAVDDEDLRVVRLELTGHALRLAGAPVTEDMADRRLLADFIIGQDGTPYAVRLVPKRQGLE